MASLMCNEVIRHFKFGMAYLFVGLASSCQELTYALPLKKLDGSYVNYSTNGDVAEGRTEVRMILKYSSERSMISVSGNGVPMQHKTLYGSTEVSFNDPRPSQVSQNYSSIKDNSNPYKLADLFGIELNVDASAIKRVSIGTNTTVSVSDKENVTLAKRANRSIHVTQSLNEGIYSHSGFILSCFSLFHLRGLGMK